jgi:hypothetical protein
MENFADVVNEITYLCVTIVHRRCQIIKKGERFVMTAQFIGDEPAGLLLGRTHG